MLQCWSSSKSVSVHHKSTFVQFALDMWCVIQSFVQMFPCQYTYFTPKYCLRDVIYNCSVLQVSWVWYIDAAIYSNIYSSIMYRKLAGLQSSINVVNHFDRASHVFTGDVWASHCRSKWHYSWKKIKPRDIFTWLIAYAYVIEYTGDTGQGTWSLVQCQVTTWPILMSHQSCHQKHPWKFKMSYPKICIRITNNYPKILAIKLWPWYHIFKSSEHYINERQSLKCV